jgi:hypothetical protein
MHTQIAHHVERNHDWLSVSIELLASAFRRLISLVRNECAYETPTPATTLVCAMEMRRRLWRGS